MFSSIRRLKQPPSVDLQAPRRLEKTLGLLGSQREVSDRLLSLRVQSEEL